MGTQDLLGRNQQGNHLTAGLIIALWAWGIVTLVSGSWRLDPAAPFFLRQLAVAIALGLLSVQSVIFYFRLVMRVRETIAGTALSIALSVIFVALLYWVPRFPYLSVLGVGTAAICVKAGQMWLMAKHDQMGVATVSYFKRIFLAYLIITLAASLVGVLEDSGRISMFPASDTLVQNREFESVRDFVKSCSGADPAKRDEMVAKIELLQKRTIATGRQFQVFSSVFFFAIMLWVLYRGFIVRGIRRSDIESELYAHYGRQAQAA